MRNGRSKKTYRKKRTFRKKRYVRRYKKGIHLFKRTFVQSIALSDTAVIQPLTIPTASNSYTLGQLPNYSEFTSLYDSYKICGIKHKFILDVTSNELGSTTSFPTLITVNDYNSGTALASEDVALQYASFKAARLDKPVKRYFRPCQVTEPSTLSQTVKSRWNQTNKADVIHRGLLPAVMYATTSSTAIGTLRVYVTYYLACRTPR